MIGALLLPQDVAWGREEPRPTYHEVDAEDLEVGDWLVAHDHEVATVDQGRGTRPGSGRVTVGFEPCGKPWCADYEVFQLGESVEVERGVLRDPRPR